MIEEIIKQKMQRKENGDYEYDDNDEIRNRKGW